jgi:hypothetical protein
MTKRKISGATEAAKAMSTQEARCLRLRMKSATSEADDYLHTGDFHTLGNRGHITDSDLSIRNIDNAAIVFAEKMMMLRRICIVPGFLTIDRQAPQQSRTGELLKRVVNGCQRNLYALPPRIFVQRIGRDMMITILKKKARKFKPLSGEPKPRSAKHDARIARYTCTIAKPTSLALACSGDFFPFNLI